jgi:hypothetical protein
MRVLLVYYGVKSMLLVSEGLGLASELLVSASRALVLRAHRMTRREAVRLGMIQEEERTTH